MFKNYRIKFWDGEKYHTVVRNGISMQDACNQLTRDKLISEKRIIYITSARAVFRKGH